MAGIALRPAGRADLAFLRSLYAGSRAAELLFVPWSAPRKEAFVQDQFALQHRHFVGVYPRADFWMIERDGEPIGRLYLDRRAPLWRIIEIGLVPGGRGQGVGTILLLYVQEAARAAKAAVDLQVARHNTRATALYARLGFLETESDEPTHRRMEWHPSARHAKVLRRTA